jgi:hypothetical protein
MIMAEEFGAGKGMRLRPFFSHVYVTRWWQDVAIVGGVFNAAPVPVASR